MEKAATLIRWLKVGRVRADWLIWASNAIRNGDDGDGETSADDDGDDAHPNGEEEADAYQGNSILPIPVLLTFSIRHSETNWIRPSPPQRGTSNLNPFYQDFYGFVVFFLKVTEMMSLCSVPFHHCSELHNHCSRVWSLFIQGLPTLQIGDQRHPKVEKEEEFSCLPEKVLVYQAIL